MTVEALHTEPLPPSGKPVRKAISKGQLLIGGKWVDAQAGLMHPLIPLQLHVGKRIAWTAWSLRQGSGQLA